MPFLLCKNCGFYHEIYSKGEPLELGTCSCGNQYEYSESLEESKNNTETLKHPSKSNDVIDQLIIAYESIIAKIVLYGVYEIPFTVTEGNLIKVLRGSKSAFIRKNNLSSLKSYGILLNFSRKRLKRFTKNLEKEGYIKLKSSDYGNPHLILTESGMKFISSGDSI